jgi:hypothetical protein
LQGGKQAGNVLEQELDAAFYDSDWTDESLAMSLLQYDSPLSGDVQCHAWIWLTHVLRVK